ncbi:MAG: hypothetical protein Mars2KO_07470 [Maribacter sp.]
MKNILITLLAIPTIILGQTPQNILELGLEEINEYLFTEYALNKNTQPLSEIATDDFMLIAAPGMIENKDRVINGVKNLNISSLNVSVDKLITTDNVGIVIGILEMKGTIMNNPIPGKIRYSSTFIKKDGNWRLISRTMTPIRLKR